MKNTIKKVALLLAVLMMASVLSVFGTLGAAAENTDIMTHNKASIRLSSLEESGIRFQTEISKAWVDELVEKHGAEDVKVGTIIVPSDYVEGIANITKEELDAEGIIYAEVPATVGSPFDVTEDAYVYAGSLVKIKLGNLQREFKAIGYLEIDDDDMDVNEIFYSDSVAQRSVNRVATVALSDLKAEAEGEYTIPTYVTGRTFYSKYTSDERVILNSFLNVANDPFGSDIFGGESSGTLPQRELTAFETKYSVQNEYLLNTYNSNVKAGDVREDLPEFSISATKCITAGNNGWTYVYNNATEADFEAYCDMLKADNFAIYTENEFNGAENNQINKFATFVTNITQVDIEFHAEDKLMYVNATPRTVSALPLREAPTYTAAGADYPTMLTQLGEEDLQSGDTPVLCLIMRIADGSFVIVDGGLPYADTVERIYDTLYKQAPDKNNIVISSWIITHADWDHFSAFDAFAQTYKDAKNITLKQVVCNYPDNSLLPEDDTSEAIKGRHDRTKERAALLNDNVEILKVHTGNVLYYADIKINMLYTQENYLALKDNFSVNYNAASLAFQIVTSDGTKIFVGGDHPVAGVEDGYCDGAIYEWYGNFIESYVTTTFHHGLGGGADEAGVVYTVIKPKVVLWNSSQSKITEHGLTNQPRNYYFTTNGAANGVTYYVAGDNVQVLTFADGVATVTEYDTFDAYKNS